MEDFKRILVLDMRQGSGDLYLEEGERGAQKSMCVVETRNELNHVFGKIVVDDSTAARTET